MNRLNPQVLNDWFGQSRACDPLGQPLLVYHGTNADFRRFELAGQPLAPGALRGFYFTPDRLAALEYGNRLIPAYLRILNPYTGNPTAYFREAHGIPRPGWGAGPAAWARENEVTPEAVKAFLIAQGHDGVFIPAGAAYLDMDQYVVFDADQILITTLPPAKSRPRLSSATRPGF